MQADALVDLASTATRGHIMPDLTRDMLLVLATFWAAVFGSDVDEDSTNGKAFVEAAGWGGPNIWFIQVPETKTAKNRMHFDLCAPGPAQDQQERNTRPARQESVSTPWAIALTYPTSHEAAPIRIRQRYAIWCEL